ncbi:transposase [Kitasatospora purpeofusca]|uniref:transposase n=1 Tax=Kitasatospora purpeofusca TaxID=67352 RepID=UPI002255C0D0|nr:transposase [Kitasatospora purpeofusca]MCX4683454.1 transposase [Kitasatospora purpeofusca]
MARQEPRHPHLLVVRTLVAAAAVRTRAAADHRALHTRTAQLRRTGGFMSMTPKAFEHVLADLCRRDGCTKVTLVGGAGEAPEAENQAVPGRLEQATRARWQQIRPLFENGMTLQAISQLTGYDLTTIRRYARAASAEELIRPRQRTRTDLDLHKAYLAQRWEEGCDNAETLRNELTERGYTGSRRTVRRFLNTLGTAVLRQPPPAPAPAVPDVVRWIIGRPENQSESAARHLKDLCTRCNHIAATRRLARGFASLLRRRDGHRLKDWLAEAEQSGITELHSFANGLRQDLAAVTAGLTVAWNSGAVDWHVNRIKMIKRQHYGRAGFDLLRRRILLA